MLPVVDFLLLSAVLTALYAVLGIMSLAFERAPALLSVRRSRRGRPATWQRVRRRAVRPRRRPGAAALRADEAAAAGR